MADLLNVFDLAIDKGEYDIIEKICTRMEGNLS